MSCRHCGGPLRPRRAGSGHRLCPNCYLRWRNAGFPEDGPPPPLRPWGRVHSARVEDFGWLRSWGVPVPDAAARVGVSVRTAQRYLQLELALGPLGVVREAGRKIAATGESRDAAA